MDGSKCIIASRDNISSCAEYRLFMPNALFATVWDRMCVQDSRQKLMSDTEGRFVACANTVMDQLVDIWRCSKGDETCEIIECFA